MSVPVPYCLLFSSCHGYVSIFARSVSLCLGLILTISISCSRCSLACSSHLLLLLCLCLLCASLSLVSVSYSPRFVKHVHGTQTLTLAHTHDAAELLKLITFKLSNICAVHYILDSTRWLVSRENTKRAHCVLQTQLRAGSFTWNVLTALSTEVHCQSTLYEKVPVIGTDNRLYLSIPPVGFALKSSPLFTTHLCLIETGNERQILLMAPNEHCSAALCQYLYSLRAYIAWYCLSLSLSPWYINNGNTASGVCAQSQHDVP